MLKKTLRFAVPAAVIGVVLASASPASAEGLGQNDNSDDGSASTVATPDDAEGHWYGGSCNSGDYEDIYGEGGDLDEFFDFAETWFDNNPAVFVPAGGQPPTPPIPPALLRDAAVNVDMADFSVTADTGDSTGPCGGPGTEWTPAQPADSASDCSIEFHRAAETGLTGESSWTVSWSFNGAPRGELDPVNQTWTTAINVGEVQATVQDVS